MHTLYFVRHGQTIWNVENKICGATDIALTDRAAETARHISEVTGIPARMEPRLIEQDFGKWESTPRDGADFRKAKEQFLSRFEGGESMLQVAQRIYNLLDDLKAEKEKTYILVAHNGIARVVQSYFYEMTNEEYAFFGVRNCAVVRYEFPE